MSVRTIGYVFEMDIATKLELCAWRSTRKYDVQWERCHKRTRTGGGKAQGWEMERVRPLMSKRRYGLLFVHEKYRNFTNRLLGG